MYHKYISITICCQTGDIMNEEKLTLSVTDAAKLLGISRTLAFSLCHSGVLPVIRLGERRLLVPKQALMELLKNPEKINSK